MNSKIFVFGLLLAITLVIAGCTQQAQNPPSSNPPVTGGSSHAVAISNFAFSPAELGIKAGDKVTWTNNDSVQHTVTGDNAEFDSGLLSPGQSFTQTFNNARTFTYHCTLHPMMKASIKVQ